MSVEALQYVKMMCASAEDDAPALSVSERHVLRAIALMYDGRVRFAYAPVPKIAFEALLSERTVQRCLGSLEGKGLLRRHWARRDKDGSQTTNEYELPGMRDTAVGLAGRQQVFTTPRTRVATQMVLLDASEAGTGTAVGLEGRQQVSEGSAEGMAVGGNDAQQVFAMATVEVVEKECAPGEMSPPPVTHVSPPPVTHVSPRDVVLEVVFEVKYPPLPLRVELGVEESAQRLPKNAKAQQQEPAKAETTATAWDGDSAESETGRSGSGELGVGRPAGRCREPRESASRAGLDGIDAALADEATRVLVACGVVPDVATRRLRNAMEAVLRMRVETSGCSVAEAGMLAVTRWKQYRAASAELRYTVGARRFFVEGDWLDVAAWPWDRKEAARRREASVGVYRP